MSHHRGYTLVELLIIITIIAILITFGLSAFTQAQARQTVQQSKELILTVLQNAQKSAYVGNKDCNGTLVGIEVKTILSGTASQISTQAKCAGGSEGAVETTEIPSITFTSFPTITFNPLDGGVTFQSGNSAQINYTIGSREYQIQVIPPGIITYVGAI